MATPLNLHAAFTELPPPNRTLLPARPKSMTADGDELVICANDNTQATTAAPRAFDSPPSAGRQWVACSSLLADNGCCDRLRRSIEGREWRCLGNDMMAAHDDTFTVSFPAVLHRAMFSFRIVSIAPYFLSGQFPLCHIFFPDSTPSRHVFFRAISIVPCSLSVPAGRLSGVNGSFMRWRRHCYSAPTLLISRAPFCVG